MEMDPGPATDTANPRSRRIIVFLGREPRNTEKRDTRAEYARLANANANARRDQVHFAFSLASRERYIDICSLSTASQPSPVCSRCAED
jgi:hypothetical protein